MSAVMPEPVCPKCKSVNTVQNYDGRWRCLDCGHIFGKSDEEIIEEIKESGIVDTEQEQEQNWEAEEEEDEEDLGLLGEPDSEW